MNRQEVDQTLRDNGEYVDGLKEWIEDGIDNDREEFYKMSQEDQIAQTEEWEQEYIETEWANYVTSRMTK